LLFRVADIHRSIPLVNTPDTEGSHDIDATPSSTSSTYQQVSPPGPSTTLLPQYEFKSAKTTQKQTFCVDCKRDFGTTSNYGKHRRDKHEGKRYYCAHPGCSKNYQRPDMAKKHMQSCIFRSGDSIDAGIYKSPAGSASS
jgi:hypothetical protein